MTIRASCSRPALAFRSRLTTVRADVRVSEAAAGLPLYYEGHAAARLRVCVERPRHNPMCQAIPRHSTLSPVILKGTS